LKSGEANLEQNRGGEANLEQMGNGEANLELTLINNIVKFVLSVVCISLPHSLLTGTTQTKYVVDHSSG